MTSAELVQHLISLDYFFANKVFIFKRPHYRLFYTVGPDHPEMMTRVRYTLIYFSYIVSMLRVPEGCTPNYNCYMYKRWCYWYFRSIRNYRVVVLISLDYDLHLLTSSSFCLKSFRRLILATNYFPAYTSPPSSVGFYNKCPNLIILYIYSGILKVSSDLINYKFVGERSRWNHLE